MKLKLREMEMELREPS